MERPGFNDAVLLLSLLYSCVDMSYEWDTFNTCQRPIHKWLLVSYACIATLRLIHLIGAHCTGRCTSTTSPAVAAEFLLNLRQKGTVSRVLFAFSWAVAIPFFLFWTLIGTAWLFEVVRTTPSCVPSPSQLWFTGIWLFLCYIWIIVHGALGVVAWSLERRISRAESDLSAVEDDDVRSRWGAVSRLSNYTALSDSGKESGLTPVEIRALPICDAGAALECTECSICLCDTQPGDCLRCLPGCGHCFHRACIDLWLLRRADCPLCKQSVRMPSV